MKLFAWSRRWRAKGGSRLKEKASFRRQAKASVRKRLAGLMLLFCLTSQNLIASAQGLSHEPEIINAAKVSSSESLNLAPNSTLVIDFSESANLSLLGDLSNAGTIYAVSTNPNVSAVSLSANNISNSIGALITTVLPSGGIAGFTNPVSNLSLSLTAVSNLVNYGTIASAGTLNITAGGSVINALPTGVSAPNPVMQAAGQLNISAGTIINQGLVTSQTANINILTAQLVNAHLIEALSASVNIQNSLGSTLHVNNRDGSISALNQINFSTRDLTGFNGLLSITGGAIEASEISFNSPCGQVTVDADSISGSVTIAGSSARLTSASGRLDLASMTLTGDPLIAISNGDVILPSSLVFHGENLAVLASGNILNNSGSKIDLSADGSKDGGNLTMVAGYKFNIDTEGSQQEFGSPAPLFTLSGPSETGGSILLSNLSINTSAQDGNAGNITLVAHAGSDQSVFRNEGVIIIDGFSSGPMSTLKAESVTGSGGNVLFIAHSDNIEQVDRLGSFVGGSNRHSIIYTDPVQPFGRFYESGESSLYLSINNSSQLGSAGEIGIFSSEPQISGGPISFQDGLQIGGSFQPARDASGKVMVASTSFQDSNTLEFSAGNLSFQGEIISSGPAGSKTVEIAGRNVSLIPFADGNDLSLAASGDLVLYGQDSLSLKEGTYSAGQTRSQEDAFASASFGKLVNKDDFLSSGNLRIDSQQLSIATRSRLLSNFGDLNINFSETYSNPDGPVFGHSTHLGSSVARGGSIRISAAAPDTRFDGVAVARAVDEPLPYRGGGIQISAGIAPGDSLSPILQAQPLDLPGLGPSIVDNEDRVIGSLVHESAELGEGVQIYRQEGSNWAALKTSSQGGAIAADYAAMFFNNGAVVLNSGSGTLQVNAMEFHVAAANAAIAPEPTTDPSNPPAPPSAPELPSRQELPNLPALSQNLSFNFDLSSEAALIPGSLLVGEGETIEISQGQGSFEIDHQDLLTAGQFVAGLQRSSGGSQTILLSSDPDNEGVAIGGSFVISNKLTESLAGMLVPAGVIALQDAAQIPVIDFRGDLLNFGSYFLYSSDSAVQEAQISARNLQNQTGGIISSNIPAQTPAGYNNAASAISFSLNIKGDLINSGVIASAGNLQLNAGSSLVNASPSAQAAQITAASDLSLRAPVLINLGQIQAVSGNTTMSVNELANLSTIESLSGSIAINNASGSMLNVSNNLGVISALNKLSFSVGSIASANDAEVQSPTLAVFGGVLQGSSVEFANPGGAAAVHAGLIDGNVSASADNLNLLVGNGDLKLSQLEVSGNTFIGNYGANIDLSEAAARPEGINSAGGEIAVMAAGSVFASSPLETSINSGGADITIAAGVLFSIDGREPGAYLNDLSGSCTHCLPSFQLVSNSPGSGSIVLPDTALNTGGGELALVSGGNIAAGNARTSAGTASSGSLTALAGVSGEGAAFFESIDSSAVGSGLHGGDVEIAAASGLLVRASLNSSSVSGSGGSVRLSASQGAVLLNEGSTASEAINTSSGGGVGNRAGSISIESGENSSISINGSVDSSGMNQASAASLNLAGGSINVTGQINSSGQAASGGDLVLTAQGSIELADLIASGGAGDGGIVALTAGLSGAGSVKAGDIVTNGSGAGHNGGLILVQAPGSVRLGNLASLGKSGALSNAVLLRAAALPGAEIDIATGAIESNPSLVQTLSFEPGNQTNVASLLKSIDVISRSAKSLSSRPFLEIPFDSLISLTRVQFDTLESYYSQQIADIHALPEGTEQFSEQLNQLSSSLLSSPSERQRSIRDMSLLKNMQELGREQMVLQEKIDKESVKLQSTHFALETESEKPFLDQNLSSVRSLLISRNRSMTKLSDLQLGLFDLQVQQTEIQLTRDNSTTEVLALGQSLTQLADQRSQNIAQNSINKTELGEQMLQLSNFSVPLQSNLKLQRKTSERIQQLDNSIDLQSTFNPGLWSDWNNTQQLHLTIDRVGEQINLTNLQIQQTELELTNAPLVGANTSELQNNRSSLLEIHSELNSTLSDLRSSLSNAKYGQSQPAPPPPRAEELPKENRFSQLLSELRDIKLPEAAKRLDASSQNLHQITNLPQVEHNFEVSLANSLNLEVPMTPQEKGYSYIVLTGDREEGAYSAQADIGKVVNQSQLLQNISIAAVQFAEKTAVKGAVFNIEKTKLENEVAGYKFQEQLLTGKILQNQKQVSDTNLQFAALFTQMGQEKQTVGGEIAALREQAQILENSSQSQSVLEQLASLQEQLYVKERVLDSLTKKESTAKAEQQSRLNELSKDSTKFSSQLENIRGELSDSQGELNKLTQDSQKLDRPFIEQSLSYLKDLMNNKETFYQVKRSDKDSKIVGLIEIGPPPRQEAANIFVEASEREFTSDEQVHVSVSRSIHNVDLSSEQVDELVARLQGPGRTILRPEYASYEIIYTDIYKQGGGTSTELERTSEYNDKQYSFFNFFDRLESSLPKDLSSLPQDLAQRLAELPNLALAPKLIVPFVQEVDSSQLQGFQVSAQRLGQSNLVGTLKDGTPVQQALAIRDVVSLRQQLAAQLVEGIAALQQGAVQRAQNASEINASMFQSMLSQNQSEQAAKVELHSLSQQMGIPLSNDFIARGAALDAESMALSKLGAVLQNLNYDQYIALNNNFASLKGLAEELLNPENESQFWLAADSIQGHKQNLETPVLKLESIPSALGGMYAGELENARGEIAQQLRNAIPLHQASKVIYGISEIRPESLEQFNLSDASADSAASFRQRLLNDPYEKKLSLEELAVVGHQLLPYIANNASALQEFHLKNIGISDQAGRQIVTAAKSGPTQFFELVGIAGDKSVGRLNELGYEADTALFGGKLGIVGGLEDGAGRIEDRLQQERAQIAKNIYQALGNIETGADLLAPDLPVELQEQGLALILGADQSLDLSRRLLSSSYRNSAAVVDNLRGNYSSLGQTIVESGSMLVTPVVVLQPLKATLGAGLLNNIAAISTTGLVNGTINGTATFIDSLSKGQDLSTAAGAGLKTIQVKTIETIGSLSVASALSPLESKLSLLGKSGAARIAGNSLIEGLEEVGEDLVNYAIFQNKSFDEVLSDLPGSFFQGAIMSGIANTAGAGVAKLPTAKLDTALLKLDLALGIAQPSLTTGSLAGAGSIALAGSNPAAAISLPEAAGLRASGSNSSTASSKLLKNPVEVALLQAFGSRELMNAVLMKGELEGTIQNLSGLQAQLNSKESEFNASQQLGSNSVNNANLPDLSSSIASLKSEILSVQTKVSAQKQDLSLLGEGVNKVLTEFAAETNPLVDTFFKLQSVNAEFEQVLRQSSSSVEQFSKLNAERKKLKEQFESLTAEFKNEKSLGIVELKTAFADASGMLVPGRTYFLKSASGKEVAVEVKGGTMVEKGGVVELNAISKADAQSVLDHIQKTTGIQADKIEFVSSSSLGYDGAQLVGTWDIRLNFDNGAKQLRLVYDHERGHLFDEKVLQKDPAAAEMLDKAWMQSLEQNGLKETLAMLQGLDLSSAEQRAAYAEFEQKLLANPDFTSTVISPSGAEYYASRSELFAEIVMLHLVNERAKASGGKLLTFKELVAGYVNDPSRAAVMIHFEAMFNTVEQLAFGADSSFEQAALLKDSGTHAAGAASIKPSLSSDRISVMETRIEEISSPAKELEAEKESLNAFLNLLSANSNLSKEMQELKQEHELRLTEVTNQLQTVNAALKNNAELRNLKVALAEAKGSYPEGEFFLSDSGQKIKIVGSPDGESVSAAVVDGVRQILDSHELRPTEITFKRVDDPKAANGGMNKRTFIITINDKGDGASRQFTYDHESGHLFDFSVISQLPAEIQTSLSQSYQLSVSKSAETISRLLQFPADKNSTELSDFISTLQSKPYHKPDGTREGDSLYLLSRNEVYAELLKLNSIKERALANGEAEPSFSSLLNQYSSKDRILLLQEMGDLYTALGKVASEHSQLRQASLPASEARSQMNSMTLLQTLYPNSKVTEETIAEQVALTKVQAPEQAREILSELIVLQSMQKSAAGESAQAVNLAQRADALQSALESAVEKGQLGEVELEQMLIESNKTMGR